MFWNKYLVPSVAVLLLVATLHAVFTRFDVYWTLRWVDIPVHILAGVWIILTLAWILGWFFPETDISFARAIIWGLIVGGLWEIGELALGINLATAHGYVADTLKDLTNDFIGAAIGFLAVRWMKNKN